MKRHLLEKSSTSNGSRKFAKMGVTMIAGVMLLSTSFVLPVTAKADFDVIKDVVYTEAKPVKEAAISVNAGSFSLSAGEDAAYIVSSPVTLSTSPASIIEVTSSEASAFRLQPVQVIYSPENVYTASRNAITGYASMVAMSMLTEEQMPPYIEMMKQQIKNTTGINLPDGITYVASSVTSEDSTHIYISCVLPEDTELSEGMSRNYSATFENVDIEKGTGSLQVLTLAGENNISIIDVFAKKAAEALKSQLETDIADNLSLDSSISIIDGNTNVCLNWYNKEQRSVALDPLSAEASPYYNAIFSDVDLKAGTGNLTSLETGILTSASSAYNAPAQYTNNEIKIMESAAKAFLQEQGIKFAEESQRYQFQNWQPKGSMLTYDCEDGNSVRVSVTGEGKITGYTIYKGSSAE